MQSILWFRPWQVTGEHPEALPDSQCAATGHMRHTTPGMVVTIIEIELEIPTQK